MSIEVEVRLGTGTVAMSALLAAIADELEARFSGHEGMMLAWSATEGASVMLGVGAGAGRLKVADADLVELQAYSVGSEIAFTEDGGWWVSFTPAMRSPEAKCLMLIAAACLARLISTRVLDDALLMKHGRWLAPDFILATIGVNRDLSLTESAARLSESGVL